MKRSVGILAAFIALAFLFAGSVSVFAGGAKEAPSSTAGSSAAGAYETTGNPPVTTQQVTLSLLGQNSGYSNADLAQAAIVLELAKRANVKINFQLLPPNDYVQAVEPRLAAGSGLPDIINLPNLDETMKYIQAGLFIPINDLYQKYGYNMKKLYEGGPLAGVKASLTTPDGKMYYVPVISLDKANAPELMINKRWLDKLGLGVPATTDDFYNALLAFKQKDPNGNGKADEIPLDIFPYYLQMLVAPSFGLDMTNRFYAGSDGKVHFTFMEPAYKQLLTYLNRLYKEGLLDNEFATVSFDTLTQRFAQDLAGATGLYSWHMSKTLSPLYKDYDPKTPIIMGIPPLKGPNGDRFYWAVSSVVGAFGISRDAKNPDVAFKFLDYVFASPDAHNLEYWGMQNKDYNVQNGTKVFIGDALNADYREKTGFDPMALPRFQDADAIRTQFDPWHAQIDASMEKYYKAPFPFVYALANESGTLNQYTTDLNTYSDEMFIKFVTGTESLGNFDAYMQTLKSLHAADVLAIKQAQYDRFSKK